MCSIFALKTSLTLRLLKCKGYPGILLLMFISDFFKLESTIKNSMELMLSDEHYKVLLKCYIKKYNTIKIHEGYDQW